MLIFLVLLRNILGNILKIHGGVKEDASKDRSITSKNWETSV
jgi:hypothetical protein